MAYRVSVTGIDGSGKSTVISEVVNELFEDYLIAKIGRPTYISGKDIPSGRKYLFESLNKKVDAMHKFADNLEKRLAVAWVNTFNSFVNSFINKQVLKKFNPEIVIYSRDRIIDPAVYSTFYFQFTKEWSSQTRLKLAQAISRSKTSDMVIYLDVNPIIAVERIEKRIEKEKKKSNVDRKKWKHMHENVQDLTNLKNNYSNALDYFQNYLNVDIRTIDVNKKNLEKVVAEIELIIRKKISKK